MGRAFYTDEDGKDIKINLLFFIFYFLVVIFIFFKSYAFV